MEDEEGECPFRVIIVIEMTYLSLRSRILFYSLIGQIYFSDHYCPALQASARTDLETRCLNLNVPWRLFYFYKVLEHFSMYIGYILHCQAPIEKVFWISMSLPLLSTRTINSHLTKVNVCVSAITITILLIFNKQNKELVSGCHEGNYLDRKTAIKSDIFIN